MYDIGSNEMYGLFSVNIENIEKLEKGDKILTSPNLQITPHNLKVLKFRLNEIKKHLPILRAFAQKDPDKFRERIIERSEILENLILDIKNPSDYLSLKRRFVINTVPFIAGYYLAVIPVVIFLRFDWSLIDTDFKKMVIPIIAGFLPLYISLIWLVYRKIREWLVITSFRFNISQFSVE